MILSASVRLPIAVGVLTLAIYLLTASSDLLGNGDTSTFRFGTTQAIVDHHRVWLDIAPGPQELRAARGRDGHTYASYGPGQSIMMIPFYVAGKVAAHRLRLNYAVAEGYATRVLNLVLASLAASLLVFFAIQLGYKRALAGLLGIIYAFFSVAWPDAQSGLEQTPVGLFLLIAVVAAWNWARRLSRSSVCLVLCGTAIGLAFWVRYDALIYLPVFGTYVFLLAGRLYPAERLKSLGLLAAGFAPWGLFVATWNSVTFGTPWSTGTHPSTFSANVIGNAAGLLASPGKGLLWYFPLVLVVPWALKAFGRRGVHLRALFVTLILVTLFFYSFVAYWHGDPSWGPRYLYPVTSLLVLPLGEVLQRWTSFRQVSRWAFLLIAAASMGIQIAAVSVTPWRFWYHLEAVQQHTFHASLWSGSPFFWGASHYHYYWDASLSPVFLQIDGLTQILRLDVLGDHRYLLQAKPASFVQTNTAAAYPVNTLAFWWADDTHPLFGPHTRDVLLALLLCLSAGSAVVVWRESQCRSVHAKCVAARPATA